MATPADTVRTLTGLTTTELTDTQITTLLELHASGVKLAAADALEIRAGQLTAVQSDDISVDGSKRAAVLMARAARLREQAAADDEDGSFAFDVIYPSGCYGAELAARPVVW